MYILTRVKTKQDFLIDFYGFIYYGHDSYNRMPIIKLPNYNINCREITKEQSEKMWDILYASDELEFYPYTLESILNNEKIDKYIDDFLERRIMEVNDEK